MSEYMVKRSDRRIHENPIGDFYRFYEEDGVLRGWGMVQKMGEAGLRWKIAVQFQQSSANVAYWDGPQIESLDSKNRPTDDDIEKARDEIDKVMENYYWDPMCLI